MCGIVGATAKRDIYKILLEGLKRLEYRGYDSAGIAVLDNEHHLHRLRAQGKVAALEEMLHKTPLPGTIGIAHTRWATHGKPAENNAHPHASHDEIAIVHNGIIENHEQLRAELIAEGYTFTSETDTEVIAHLLHAAQKKQKDFLHAVQAVVKKLHGAYALGILNTQEPNRLIAVRQGSPLVIGVGIDEHFIASDNLALLPVTQKFIYLEEGDIADIYHDHFTLYDKNLTSVERNVQNSQLTHSASNKGKFRHFMLKEIFEQPGAISETLEGRTADNHILEAAFGIQANDIFQNVKQIQIIACGTSYHAGLIAKHWIEELAKLPCQVDIASEIRYRNAVISPDTLLITISQSGETADTLAALREAKKNPAFIASLAICNVPESSLVRESDLIFMTRAGREIGVASTKAFTTQLVALFMLALLLGRHHGLGKKETELVKLLQSLPSLIEKMLSQKHSIQQLESLFSKKEHALFLGRGIEYPVALEGALKLKEISYIHAEAYPAGELKHGPLALVDNDLPVIVLLPNDHLVEKNKSNIQEVQARGGKIIAFVDENIDFQDQNSAVIKIPHIDPLLMPILMTIPMQLLAYYIAVSRGTDVDQPRNLAKSVTVE